MKIIDPLLSKSEIVVIGSGPGGAFAAKRLTELGHKVLLIEAGETGLNMEFDKYFDIDSSNTTGQINLGLSWQLGGSSNLWAGRSAYFEPRDISELNRWPFSYNDIVPYYDYVSNILDIDSETTLKNNSSKLIEELDKNWKNLLLDQELSLKKFQWSNPPFNTRSLIDQMCKSGLLEVATGYRLLSFENINKNRHACTAIFAKKDGSKITISDRIFILAVGGIEVVRILLNSCGGNSIGNSSGLVGSYFSTHPKMNIGKIKLRNFVSINHPLFKDKLSGKNYYRFGLGLNIDSDQENINHYLQLSFDWQLKKDNFLELLFGKLVNVKSEFVRPLIKGKIGSFLVFIGSILYRLTSKFDFKTKELSLRLICDQYQNKQSRISLSSNLDPYGMPKAQIEWHLSSKDILSIENFMKKFKAKLEEKKIGSVEYVLPNHSNENPIVGIHSHFMGTTRMGNNPSDSVTNQYGMLHDCPNIFISGPSTFPSYGYANPFLTIAALAVRTAEHISLSK